MGDKPYNYRLCFQQSGRSDLVHQRGKNSVPLLFEVRPATRHDIVTGVCGATFPCAAKGQTPRGTTVLRVKQRRQFQLELLSAKERIQPGDQITFDKRREIRETDKDGKETPVPVSLVDKPCLGGQATEVVRLNGPLNHTASLGYERPLCYMASRPRPPESAGSDGAVSQRIGPKDPPSCEGGDQAAKDKFCGEKVKGAECGANNKCVKADDVIRLSATYTPPAQVVGIGPSGIPAGKCRQDYSRNVCKKCQITLCNSEPGSQAKFVRLPDERVPGAALPSGPALTRLLAKDPTHHCEADCSTGSACAQRVGAAVAKYVQFRSLHADEASLCTGRRAERRGFGPFVRRTLQVRRQPRTVPQRHQGPGLRI